ncbi:MAG: transcription elongation factor GreA [Hydrotalea sp.]|nr:transcription elongation factor GreA [Hydrotalea sp.]
MQKIHLTRAGHDRLKEELSHLKKVERPATIQAIATAREHGDLSENADYSAAREKQGFIEGRINELEDKLARAEVMTKPTDNLDMVQFGAMVKVKDDKGKELTYQLVGELEADISQGSLSTASPIGRALMGKKAGDMIDIITPGGEKTYHVLAVSY